MTQHHINAIHRTTCDRLDPADPIFHSVHSDYPEFPRWFAKCQETFRPCHIIQDQQGLVAIAIHHLEYETVVKCSTFKVRPDQRHRGIGTSLLTRVCHDAIREMARTLYITVPQRHTNLMAFLMYHGFDGETHRPPQNRDMVFVKDLIRSPTCQNPRSLNSIKN